MKALITGITGFVGSHLADLLLTKDVEVIGLTRWRSPKENIHHLVDKVILEHGDLLDFSSLLSILEKHRPDVIFHLAAQSYVVYSFAAPIATLEANVIGTCNLLEAVRHLRGPEFDPIIHVCSSSECYGQVKEGETPITEDNPFRPASPYAVSKVAEDMLALQYFLSWGMKTIRTRLFTHSVSYDSPVLIRHTNGLIDYLPISDIRKGRDKTSSEIWDGKNLCLEVWDGQKFTKIINISAHRLNQGKLLKFVTSKSIVDVTNNHSIYDGDDNLVLADELLEGQRLAVRELPSEITETDSISEHFAWLLGFWVAEGCVKEGRKVCSSNKDQELLHHVADLVKLAWCKSSSIKPDKDMFLLTVLRASELAELLNNPKSTFGIYTRCKDRVSGKRFKKVPQLILNSSTIVQEAFLDGYNAGDGRKGKHLKYKYQEFKTNSQCLAAGLCFLISRTTQQEYTLNCEAREMDNKTRYYYSINLRSNNSIGNKGKHLQVPTDVIKKKLLISDEKNEWVYDMETETHFFSCGIGSVKVHNTGPRRGEVFVVSNFAKQIAEIEKGLRSPVISVGNLDSIRTFMDVRDAVKAYWLLVNMCPAGEVYNVGGNATMSIKEMLDKLLQLSSKNIEVQIDPNRLRPSDVTLQIPSTDKFRAATGWQPEIDFDVTLKDTLEYWRNWRNV